jgi:anti-sigma factor RsiW
MLTPVPPSDCTRARQAASARLDDELSEFETASLEAHLAGCADCEAYAREIAEVAQHLRFASLEPVPAPMFVPSRHRPVVRVQVAAAAVLVLLATGSSFAIGQLLGSHGSAPSATVATTVTFANRKQPDFFGTVRKLRPGRMPLAAVIPV